jgi:shikimate dehydrogenase
MLGVKAAVLGSPIAHSLSPALHRVGYAALGLTDWSYSRFELVATQLPGFVAGLDAQWRGLSLTMPLKVACLEVADQVTPLAARAGAGNTLVRTSDGWLADNTDIPGLVMALRPAWHGWSQAAVLGAGATARSAVLALEALGVTEAHIYARNALRAGQLIDWAREAASGLRLDARDLSTWVDGDEPVVLSTLPGGAADPTGLSPRGGLLFDAVYAGWPTPLAAAANAAGMEVVGGIELLIAQAALQFELFTGQRPPELAMRAAAAAALSKKIVLVGFMGAGKTTVGRRLAARLGMDFVDADEAVVTTTGRSVADIFATDGEARFRELEAATIADLLTGFPAVIALGGGALGSEAVRQALAGHQVLLLDISLAEALARVGGDADRPMLARDDLAQLYDSRQEAYHAVATAVVASAAEVDDVVEAAFAAVRAAAHTV